MSTHPIFTEQTDDEDWIDWYQRQFTSVTANPPAAPEGFVLVPCSAEPRHWPAYVLDLDGEEWEHSCHLCSYEELAERHAPCEHNQHGAWRSWRITKKVAAWLYQVGLVSGWGTTHSRYCNGCLTTLHWSWFRGPYVLFVSRETWHCWRQGHRRGDEIGFGYCAKCIPWYCCGSTRREHIAGCSEQDA